jgi:hypothetical protein
MRAFVIAAALVTVFTVAAAAQTTSGTPPASGVGESGAGKPYRPTGRVDQRVPPIDDEKVGSIWASRRPAGSPEHLAA